MEELKRNNRKSLDKVVITEKSEESYLFILKNLISKTKEVHTVVFKLNWSLKSAQNLLLAFNKLNEMINI